MTRQDILEKQVKSTYLAIGSNLGDKKKNIEKAKKLLSYNKVYIMNTSSYYETPSWPNRNFPKFFTGTGYVVTPFLGIIKSKTNWQKLLKPNLSEVEQIFFPPTDCLLLPEFHLREKPPINSSMSMTWTINFDGKNIWGLTARVLVTISAGLGLREFPPCDDI